MRPLRMLRFLVVCSAWIFAVLSLLTVAGAVLIALNGGVA